MQVLLVQFHEITTGRKFFINLPQLENPLHLQNHPPTRRNQARSIRKKLNHCVKPLMLWQLMFSPHGRYERGREKRQSQALCKSRSRPTERGSCGSQRNPPPSISSWGKLMGQIPDDSPVEVDATCPFHRCLLQHRTSDNGVKYVTALITRLNYLQAVD